MANITLRAGRATPLSIQEVDTNFTNLNTDKLEASEFTAANILTRLLTVDGAGSQLDADLVDGLSPTSANQGSTIVARDSSGNFSANTITANLLGNVTGTLTGTANNALTLGGILPGAFALLNSPALLGTPTAPTATAGTNTTQLATTAFVRTAVTAVSNTLGSMSTQNSNSVAITGGAITNTTINGQVVGTNATGNKTVSTSLPSGGANGDIWYQY
jgi:hypothetical protein